jgi:hypothetical protein
MIYRFVASAIGLFVCTIQPVAAEPTETRTEAMFNIWAEQNKTLVADFKTFLTVEDLDNIYPIHQLARTASDWKTCGGPPFDLPPKRLWPRTKSTLSLVKLLMEERVFEGGEVVSAYRKPRLNICAGGSKKSSHTAAFALDIKGIDGSTRSLCRFFRTRGAKLNMGLSRYPSGRIHLDAHGYRTWGSDFTSKTSFCRDFR